MNAFTGNGGATYALHTVTNSNVYIAKVATLLAATSHTMTNAYATFYTQWKQYIAMAALHTVAATF